MTDGTIRKLRITKRGGKTVAYVRKTYDEYDIVTNYGYGWEVECSEPTMKEARQTKKEYIENASGLIGIKIVKRRVKIDAGQSV